MHYPSIQVLKRNFFLALMFMAWLPLILFMGWGGYGLYLHARQANLEQLELWTDNHAQLLDQYFKHCFEDLAWAASLVFESQDKQWEQVFTILSLKHKLQDLAVFDQYGKLKAYVGPPVFTGTHIETDHWFDQAWNHGFSIHEQIMGPQGLSSLVLGQRLLGKEDAYVLRVTLDPHDFLALFKSTIPQDLAICLMGNNGQVLFCEPMSIIQDQGWLMAHNDPQLKGKHFWSSRVYAQQDIGHSDWVLAVARPLFFSQILKATKYFWILGTLGAGGLIFLFAVFFKGYWESVWVTHDQEQKSLREQLFRAGRLAELGEMAAGFAHEINNPLQIIKSDQAYIEMLAQDFLDQAQDDVQFKADVQDLLSSIEQIKVQIDRCARITHSILSFGRVKQVEEQYLDVGQFVSQVLTMVEKQAQVDNIQIQLNLYPTALIVHADPGHLQQVLLNLFNNALHAILAIDDGRSGRMVVSCLPHNEHMVRISIADNGVGINPEHRQLIFTPFFTTKPVGSGTGLGLSVCHDIVKSMNGLLDFTSTPGQGTTFFVILPRVPSSAS